MRCESQHGRKRNPRSTVRVAKLWHLNSSLTNQKQRYRVLFESFVSKISLTSSLLVRGMRRNHCRYRPHRFLYSLGPINALPFRRTMSSKLGLPRCVPIHRPRIRTLVRPRFLSARSWYQAKRRTCARSSCKRGHDPCDGSPRDENQDNGRIHLRCPQPGRRGTVLKHPVPRCVGLAEASLCRRG